MTLRMDLQVIRDAAHWVGDGALGVVCEVLCLQRLDDVVPAKRSSYHNTTGGIQRCDGPIKS